MLEEKTTNRENILKIVSRISELPYDYDAVNDVLYLLKDSNANFIQLAKTIQRDHSLFIKILGEANSSARATSQKVYTIERAISILGLDNVEKIVMEIIKNDPVKIQDSDSWYRNIFWRHSVFVANTARSISEDLNYKQPGDSFTAGFLHDIGVFIIRYFFSNEYLEIKDLVEHSEVPFMKAEKIVLGTDHLEIAGNLIKKWNLPGEIKDAVVNHRNPSDCSEGLILSSVVHLSDFITYWIGINRNLWDNDLQFDENIISILKLNDHKINEQIPFAVHDIVRDILLSRSRNGKNNFHSHTQANHFQ